jgi:hypothetical protein
MKVLEIFAASAGLLLLAYLVDLACKKGVLVQAFAVSFLALLAVLIVGSVIWFEFHKPYGM